VTMDGSLSLNAAHALTEQIQQVIRQINPEIDVTVHAEPPK
jgi:divalent metal cation (Fe/Co/Zn/Cd) transporter